jgi:hypothetical protein
MRTTSTSTSLYLRTWRWWLEVTPSVPVRKPLEAGEIIAIQALQMYLAKATAGSLDSSLGPLLALSVMAVRNGLAGEEVFAIARSLGETLHAHGHHRAAREVLGGAIAGFIEGGDHQAAADAFELLAIMRLEIAPAIHFTKNEGVVD